MTRSALVTGSSGFIGYHLCRLLLEEGWQVAGYDGLSDYYDVALKEARHAELARHVGDAEPSAQEANRILLRRIARIAEKVRHRRVDAERLQRARQRVQQQAHQATGQRQGVGEGEAGRAHRGWTPAEPRGSRARARAADSVNDALSAPGF